MQVHRRYAAHRSRMFVQHQQVVVLRAMAVGLAAASDGAHHQAFATAGQFARRRDVALPGNESLPVFQPAQFLDRRHRDVGVRSDADTAAVRDEITKREHAIAQVGLRGRAQRHHRLAGSDAGQLRRLHMRRMHQRPCLVHGGIGQQPFDGARAARGNALFNFGGLFGDMDVDRSQRAQLRRGEHLAHRIGGHGTQAVQGDTDPQHRIFLRCQGVQQRQVGVHVVAEAHLPIGQFAAIESTGHVQHRQQGEADTRFPRRGDDRPGHRRRIVVGLPICLMMQVVEFAGTRIASLEHLDEQLRADVVQRLGRQPAGEAIHQLAPGPEAVRALRSALGHSRHRALEGMGMDIGNTGQDKRAHARILNPGRIQSRPCILFPAWSSSSSRASWPVPGAE